MSYSLNGSSDYLSIADSSTLTLADADWVLIFRTYVSDNSGTGAQFLFSAGDGASQFGNNSINLRLNEDSAASNAGKWSITVRDNSGNYLINANSSTAPGGDSTGRWIVVQRRGADSQIQMWFCDDGGAATKVASAAIGSTDVVNCANWYFGRSHHSASTIYFYNGRVCEFYKGGISFTQAQIESFANGDPWQVAYTGTSQPGCYFQLHTPRSDAIEIDPYNYNIITVTGSPTAAAHPTINAGNTYYVDKTTGSDSDDGKSLVNAWATIGKADTIVQPGDTVYIVAETYVEDIQPSNGGSYGRSVTYQPYNTDIVTIKPSSGACLIVDKKEYITFDGFICDEDTANTYWVYMGNSTAASNHMRGLNISNCTFNNGDGAGTGATGIHFQQADYPIFSGNTLTQFSTFVAGAPDHTKFNTCNYGLIESNTWASGAGHCCLGLDTCTYTVVLNNTALNPLARIAFDQDGTHNVWHGNNFHDAVQDPDGDTGDGIQVAGCEYNIFRYNRFWNCGDGTGLDINSYAGSVNTRYNRIYNNVAYANGAAGIQLYDRDGTTDVQGNVFCNNAMVLNTWTGGNIYQASIRGDVTADWENSLWFNNLLFSTATGQNIVYQHFDGADSVADTETAYPAVWYDNVDADPYFVDAVNGDFRIYASSPMLNTGAFLTTANGAGSGSVSLIVNDSTFFFDGFGITTGDTIVIGSNDPVAISSINYGTHTITLASAKTWANSDPVSLEYNGAAPNIGAYETIVGSPWYLYAQMR